MTCVTVVNIINTRYDLTHVNKIWFTKIKCLYL